VSLRFPDRFPQNLLTRVSGPASGLVPGLVLALACAAALPAAAQYPGQVSNSGNAPALRAVSVFEWTGDEQHPNASRIIPITVFDGQQLQDGGIYLASPAPLSLQTEVEYQLKQDGKNVGLFVIQNAALEQGSWVGHGAFKDLPKPKPVAPPMWKGDEDDVASDEPVLHRKHHADDSAGSSGSGSSGQSGQAGQGAPSDPDRPTLHRTGDASSSGSGSGSSNSDDAGANAPPPDPDRPTLSNPPPASTSSSAPGSDRPALKKKSGEDDSYVSSMDSSSDPDRPQLVRGKTAYVGPNVMPSFVGVPADMEQSVAVSDSRNAPEHLWSYSWANTGDEAKYKSDLEDMARTALGLNPPPATPKKSATAKTTAGHKTQLTLPPPPAPLLDEQFHVFELAYGSGATIVFSAHTDGTGAGEKFVTLIAQPDLYGGLAVLMKNVTDAADLDQTPRMRLIDAVDAMADNRGELLFELRGATERQFALYRVLRGQATQVFVTGSKDFGPANN
jgi:hypothetical protein